MNLPEFLAEDRYGFIHVAGHRVGLNHIVHYYNDRYAPEMLQDQFPTLSLALIHKVIAFYLDNTAIVDEYMLRCRAEIDRQAAAAQSGPDAAELQRRMAAKRSRESA
jgi:uncharacterized protein (DUF433 family)